MKIAPLRWSKPRTEVGWDLTGRSDGLGAGRAHAFWPPTQLTNGPAAQPPNDLTKGIWHWQIPGLESQRTALEFVAVYVALLEIRVMLRPSQVVHPKRVMGLTSREPIQRTSLLPFINSNKHYRSKSATFGNYIALTNFDRVTDRAAVVLDP